jgi:hypothetical protein
VRPLRSFMHSAVLALTLTAALVEAAPVHAAPPGEKVDPEAQRAFEQGRDAYENGRFAEALQHFERAYEISRSPKLLFNIGRAADSDLQPQRAVEAYQAYLDAVRDADNRAFVVARIEKLREAQRASAPVAPPAPAAPVARPSAAPRPAAAPERGSAPYVTPGYGDAPARSSAAAAGNGRGVTRGARLYAGFRVGAGGEVEDDYTELSIDEDDSLKADLGPSFGFQIGAGYVWSYFGIGGELRMTSVKPDVEGIDLEDVSIERDTLLDLVAKPRGGYQFPNLPLEVYGALPFGVSILKSDNEYSSDLDPGVGFTVGFVAGATYFFTKTLGLNAEIGWSVHAFGYEDEEYEGTVSFTQWSPLTLNLVLAL